MPEPWRGGWLVAAALTPSGSSRGHVRPFPLTRIGPLRRPPVKIRYYDARTDTHTPNWSNSALLDERAGPTMMTRRSHLKIKP